jgi:hypothetical protein
VTRSGELEPFLSETFAYFGAARASWRKPYAVDQAVPHRILLEPAVIASEVGQVEVRESGGRAVTGDTGDHEGFHRGIEHRRSVPSPTDKYVLHPLELPLNAARRLADQVVHRTPNSRPH